jgi:hypothetical protein
MSPQTYRTPLQTYWTIWACLLGWTILSELKNGGGIPRGADKGGVHTPIAILVISGAFAVASLFIRWFVVPRRSDRRTLLILMIIGLALACSLTDFGIYLVSPDLPQTRLVFWVISLICTVQFAPIYVSETGTNGSLQNEKG